MQFPPKRFAFRQLDSANSPLFAETRRADMDGTKSYGSRCAA
jgi:hypothetical protein